MTDDTRELIEEARRFDTVPAEYAVRLLGSHSLIRRLADALEASLPTEDDREALAKALFDADAPVVGYERRYPDEGNEDVQTGQEWRYYLPMADRLAAGFRRSPVPPEVDKPEPQPEDYCHRCGGKNISWATPSDVWNPIMRPDGPDSPWEWNEIICPLCFAELFEARFPNTSWEMRPDDLTRGAKAFRAEFPALAAVPPVTEEPDLPNGHAPVEQLPGFLARRVVPPVPEETVREWADYFEHHSSHVGGRPVFTGDEIAAILRGPKPFGSSRPVPEGDER